MGVDSTKGSTPPPRDTQPARGSLIYAVGIALALLGVLAVALYGISSEGTSPELAQTVPAEAAQPAPPARHDVELGARLGSLDEQLEALAQRAAALHERVETLERELARRAAAPVPAPVPSAGSSVPADLAPLFERLSTVETSLQREGAARLESQEDLLVRVFKLESSRQDGEAARLAAQRAADERVYKLEQRVHAAEAQLVEAERRLAARLERLESR